MSLADSVLLIEGDASVADALANALRDVVRWVCRVTTAEGLQAARDEHAELIVLDVGAAWADGVAMCRAPRSSSLACGPSCGAPSCIRAIGLTSST